MRKLASIKIISNIVPIKNRDRIVLATIDGWNVIVKKDEFKVGDKCVYVEIDSVMPEKEEFEFLRKNNFRIKTMKMAGVISQGICFPLSILPVKKNNKEYEVDENVTNILGIKQYEKAMDKEPANINNTKKKYPKFLMRMAWFRKIVSNIKKTTGDFPSFISKTDETRIQNIPEILKDKETKWIATEKIDGQSGTFCLVRHRSKIPFIKDKFEYMVCSRNLRLYSKNNSSYWKISDKYQIKDVLRNIIGNKDWVVIQGECIAPNVQENKYKVNDVDFYVFNIIYPTGRLSSLMAYDICERNSIKFVPIIKTNIILPDTVDKILEYAHGQSAIGNTLREGIVFRSIDGKQSFKAVDPQFLLQYDE